jgi:hypothetical protein
MFKEDHVKRDLPFFEGWKLGFQSDWIWHDNIWINTHHLWSSIGGEVYFGWAGELNLDYYNGNKTLPLATMGTVMTPRAFQEKYYMYSWAEEVANITAQLSHAILREDIRTELRLNHSKFSQAVWEGLNQYEESGLTSFDISINYFTIIGSLGWSFYELENYKGASWTEIGITL